MRQLFLLASEESAGTGLASLFGALGVDWRTLLLNALAFLIVVWVMAKYIYPILIKALDAKLAEMEMTTRLKQEAQQHLTKAEEAAGQIVREAREAAQEIVATAKHEGKEVLQAAEARAATQADRIVSEAREQVGREVEAARRALRAETIGLVAQATEAVVGEKLDSERDTALIVRHLKEKT